MCRVYTNVTVLKSGCLKNFNVCVSWERELVLKMFRKNQPLFLIMKTEEMRTFLSLTMLLIIIDLTHQGKGINKEASNENKWMCLVFYFILYQYLVLL